MVKGRCLNYFSQSLMILIEIEVQYGLKRLSDLKFTYFDCKRFSHLWFDYTKKHFYPPAEIKAEYGVKTFS